MKCEGFQIIAAALARNEIMDADERAGALAHAAACESCAEVLAWQSRLSEGFRSLALETKAAQAPPVVEDKLLAAFRERTRVLVPVSPTRRHFWISAAATVLLLAVGILGWRWYVASAPQPIEQAKSQNAAGNVAPSKPEMSPVVAVSPSQPPNASAPLVSRRVRSPKHSTTPAAKLNVARRATESSLSATTHEIKEITSAFVPLGYGSALDLQDGGQMVRVELPRSALARFGLPMNMNRANEKIKADVLVGADGLARAIRFVQPINEPNSGLKTGNEREE
ncbi:MAG TPA: hypothetical protein VEM96_17940 [Pyrinomonadaceae bacterium]|nr:hypothetical protein [Pyrinomonadaceae bacterium]